MATLVAENIRGKSLPVESNTRTGTSLSLQVTNCNEAVRASLSVSSPTDISGDG